MVKILVRVEKEDYHTLEEFIDVVLGDDPNEFFSKWDATVGYSLEKRRRLQALAVHVAWRCCTGTRRLRKRYLPEIIAEVLEFVVDSSFSDTVDFGFVEYLVRGAYSGKFTPGDTTLPHAQASLVACTYVLTGEKGSSWRKVLAIYRRLLISRLALDA